MKKLVFLAICVGGFLAAQAQGNISFFNLGAPVTDTTGTAVAGANFQGQLYVDSGGGFSPVGSPTPAIGAGLFNGGSIDVGTTDPVQVQLRAWGGGAASYEDAQAAVAPIGISNEITVTPTLPPATPAGLTGLQGFQLQAIPEPSTIALGLIGALALFLRRRK